MSGRFAGGTIKRVVSRIIRVFARLLPAEALEALVIRLVQRQVGSLPPAEALRFLFHLDAEMYSLQGSLAVAYGGGKHTKHRHTTYHDFFVERIHAGERVLDIGCGNGDVAFDLVTRSGAIVDGIDHNATSIEEAKSRYSHPSLRFVVGDATKWKVDQPYDVVLLSNVLEHLNGRGKFLREIVRETGAKRVFVRVPLFERDWRVPLKKELGVEWRLDEDHKTEYTLESFADELREAGLSVKHLEVRWGEIWSELVSAEVR